MFSSGLNARPNVNLDVGRDERVMLGKQLDDDVANSEQSSIAKNNSKVLKLPTDKGLHLANISESSDLIGQDFKLVSSGSHAKDGKEEDVNVTQLEKCHFKGKLLDGNETEVRIDSCSGEGEDEIEITVLWEEPEKKGAGASFEPDINFTKTAAAAAGLNRSPGDEVGGVVLTIDVAVFVESLILKDFQEYWRGRKPPKEAILANIVSLFNKAEAYFSHSSLGHKVKLRLKKVYIIRGIEEGPNLGETNHQYLRAFQRFQHKNRVKTRGLWDYAVLFFGRLDLDPNYRCDMGGMCRGRQSASIVPFEIWSKVLDMLKKLNQETVNPKTGEHVPTTDTSFYRNYIESYNVHFLVRAIASSLGMDIDEKFGCSGNQFIMSASADFALANRWSKCSRNLLETWLDKEGNGNCLRN